MLIRILLLSLLAFTLHMPAECQSALVKNQLERADQLFLNGKYADARDEYLKIVNAGYHSAALYYNTANAFYKTGQIPYAILFYERALLLSPRDEDIRFNLNLANQIVIDRINPVNEFFIKRWIATAASSLGINGWAIISLVTFALLGVVVVFLYAKRSSRFRQFFFSFGIILLVLWITSISLSVVQSRIVRHGNYAIVFTPSVTAKSSPDNSGTDLFVVHEGLKVKITDQVGSWIRIRLPDGNEAWVLASDVEKI